MSGSDRTSSTKADRNLGYLLESWTARVGKIDRSLGSKEGGIEPAICKCPLDGRLCDRSLIRPGEPIQPVDGAFVFVQVVDPELDLVQNCRPCALEATAAFSVLIPGFFCI